jgi:nanoRNase/pAp phosphatase (c-di-AMP/oligoRNAs hydrolase)
MKKRATMASTAETGRREEHPVRLVEHGAPVEEKPAGKKGTELHAVLAQHQGEKLLVILTGYPDPDNIASGLAHQFLAKELDIDTTLLCFHEVSHQENRALVKRLEIDLQLYDEHVDLQPYSAYAFVDTQKTETPIAEQLAEKVLVSFVDHHKRLGEVAAEFVDIREDAASTSAIYTDYLRTRYPHGLTPGEVEHVRLATALMHGIRSDTVAFLEATRLEFEAAAYLWPCVDQAVLKKIAAQSLAPPVLDMIQQALEKKQIFDTFIFTDVGFVRREHRDGIPQTADFLLQREGTETVLVFGIVDGKVIDGSLRTRSDTINPDTFLKKAFGLDAEKRAYYGGGNIRDKGGFQIPLGFLGQYADRELLYRMTCESVQEKFLEAIGRTT